MLAHAHTHAHTHPVRRRLSFISRDTNTRRTKDQWGPLGTPLPLPMLVSWDSGQRPRAWGGKDCCCCCCCCCCTDTRGNHNITHTHTHAQSERERKTHTHTRTHTLTHTCSHTLAHTHTHTRTHSTFREVLPRFRFWGFGFRV